MRKVQKKSVKKISLIGSDDFLFHLVFSQNCFKIEAEIEAWLFFYI